MAEIIASTYEILEKIGAGGGGVVYLAEHKRLHKKVVLKADKRKITTREDALRREVDVLKNLHHPNIPQVYDFFIEDDTVYTVMDFIEGRSLDKPLKEGERFSQAQVVKWAVQLLSALSYLHSPTHGDPPKGYVHSDIKPANIMRKPNGDIVLIDFNIALALGEENVVGRSAGYASPEHYGLDYSGFFPNGSSGRSGYVLRNVNESTPQKKTDATDTGTIPMTETDFDATETYREPSKPRETQSEKQSTAQSTSSSLKRIVVPDARSDIYSVGAVLYHLLSGQRPAEDATQVTPLSASEFSPLVVSIIEKAMMPNPDLRYRSADEMLDDFLHLKERDPRTLRLKRQRKVAVAASIALILLGGVSVFIGQARQQKEENFMRLAGESREALSAGDAAQATALALRALPDQTNLLTPAAPAEANAALTDALGIYDLSDGYRETRTVALQSEPLFLTLSPDGKTAACVISGETDVLDTSTGEILATLPTDPSALSEVVFLDNKTIVYAGADGITAYDILAGNVLWTGEKATVIRASADGNYVAAIYLEDDHATIYNAMDGTVKNTISFSGRKQSVVKNNIFLNPNDNLLALDKNGDYVAISFSDGSLELFPVENPSDSVIIFEEGSGYTHFEGGFFGSYFVFSAESKSGSVFAVLDTVSWEVLQEISTNKPYTVLADESGIVLAEGNVAVRLDPVSGKQTPVIMTDHNVTAIGKDKNRAAVASDKTLLFFNESADLLSEIEKGSAVRYIALQGDTAVVGSADSPTLSILEYQSHEDLTLFSYDTDYPHDEARVCADGRHLMLFSIDGFRIFDENGNIEAESSLGSSDKSAETQIYDMQYVRDGSDSTLEVIYYDGTVRIFDAATGKERETEKRDTPDPSLEEEFLTDAYRIVSPLHGAAEVYDLASGEPVAEISEDAYLTYAYQVENGIVLQFMTVDGGHYGLLLNEDAETVAHLPYLCDVKDNMLIFDYPTGVIRQSEIYDIEELKNLARK